jgi:3-oxoacyl-[acyl-carrier-protein] synthase II
VDALKRRRVVITGVGALASIGSGREAFWDALASGTSGVGRITAFDSSTFPVRIAAEAQATGFASLGIAEPVPKSGQLALLAAEEAVGDARLGEGAFDPARAGVIFSINPSGYHIGQIRRVYPLLREYLRGAAADVIDAHPAMQEVRDSIYRPPAATAVLAARRYGLRGYTGAGHTACATGNQAIGDAFRVVQRGVQDLMLAGSASASVHPVGILNFALLNALSTTNDSPHSASRPFDRLRNGFVMGEGGAALVLEELGHARARGAKVYGEIVGYGVSLDTYTLTQMDPEATGSSLCIRRALEEGEVSPGEVDYINAHGTSTVLNDKTETLAIKKMFGQRAPEIPISSTKSMIGHLLAGAGTVELVAALMAFVRDVIHPTINYEVPDPDCDLDYVPNVARAARVNTILSNSFGFGGQNSCLVVRRFAA